MDGDRAGNDATQKIMQNIPNVRVRDIRSDYGISENGSNDLNNYLENRDKIQNKNRKLAEDKNIDNERNIEQSAGISNPQSVERRKTISNDRNLD